MRHKGNILLVTGVAPLCLCDCLCTGMISTYYSHTADMSFCPEELIYSEMYWAQLPHFVLTGSRGEKECGDKQN